MALLDIPRWLPPPLVEVAEAFLREIAKDHRSITQLAILRRVVNDPRMESVWNRLNERRRVNYRPTAYYRYSKFSPDKDDWLSARIKPSAADVKEINERIHDIELRAFFCAVFQTAVIRPPVITLREFSRLTKSAKRNADILREYLNGDQPQIAAVIDRLEMEAATKPVKYGAHIVTRNTRDRETRGAVISISQAMSCWFGSSLDGTVAMVTNVALGLKGTKQLTTPKVRAILRGGRAHGTKPA